MLVPGDPGRAERIAEGWDHARRLSAQREYSSFVGESEGTPLGVVSSGIGGPSVAIAIEELAAIGVRTVVRVGSSGAVAAGVRGGDIVISTAAARFEGTSRVYAPLGFPAVAHPEVLRALVDSAQDLGIRSHVGITATVDTFHLSQGRPGFRGYQYPPGSLPWSDLAALGILNVEMEASTLLTIANLYGLRAGVVCAVYPEGPEGQPVPAGEADSVRVATEAARRLSRSEPPGPPTRSRRGKQVPRRAGEGRAFGQGRFTRNSSVAPRSQRRGGRLVRLRGGAR